MKRIFIFITILLVCSCHQSKVKYENQINQILKIENDEAFKVIGVKDGDTIVVLVEGKPFTIRLSDIDCPEKKQPFGKRAKLFTSTLCFGKEVKLKGDKYDRYKRLIAEVILPNGKILNKELVKSGLAWHFKKYSKNEEYANLELEARASKIGLWSEENPIAPWEWRHLRRKK